MRREDDPEYADWLARRERRQGISRATGRTKPFTNIIEGGGQEGKRYKASDVAARRSEIAQQILDSMIDPSDVNAIGDFIQSIGVPMYKDDNPAGGLSHAYKLWTGQLDPEGYGMYNDAHLGNIPKAIWDEVFQPAIGRTQRALQAGHLERDPESGLLFNRDPGGDINNPQWYDIYGRRINNAPYSGAIKFPRGGKPGQTPPNKPISTPGVREVNPLSTASNTVTKPKPATPTPAFYGSTSATPYGLGYASNPRPTARPRPPAWYSTWRY